MKPLSSWCSDEISWGAMKVFTAAWAGIQTEPFLPEGRLSLTRFLQRNSGLYNQPSVITPTKTQTLTLIRERNSVSMLQRPHGWPAVGDVTLCCQQTWLSTVNRWLCWRLNFGLPARCFWTNTATLFQRVNSCFVYILLPGVWMIRANGEGVVLDRSSFPEFCRPVATNTSNNQLANR